MNTMCGLRKIIHRNQICLILKLLAMCRKIVPGKIRIRPRGRVMKPRRWSRKQRRIGIGRALKNKINGCQVLGTFGKNFMSNKLAMNLMKWNRGGSEIEINNDGVKISSNVSVGDGVDLSWRKRLSCSR